MRPLFLKVFLMLLVLLACRSVGCAQDAPTTAVYLGPGARYQLTYPRAWQLRRNVGGAEANFAPGSSAPHLVPAVATLTVRTLPDAQREIKLLTKGRQDSLWRRVLQLPKAQVLRIEQHDLGSYDELYYEYAYTPAPPAVRTRVVGRQLWHKGYEFRLEYWAEVGPDDRYLAEARQLVESFAFTDKPLPSRRYTDQACDGKMYGISAMRYRDGQWEDDCRTIHEFSTSDLSDRATVHRYALPFQSYALAKGFDNCLYSVTKAPTDMPELVYRYDPATRRGSYTTWRLPAQGPGNVWISAATDDRGDLYFLTSDANQLVKVSPYDGSVTVVWDTDPVQKTPFYNAIAFPGAGTHGNFCLDDAGTMYLVYSTDGSLLKVDLKTRKALPDLMGLTGLPTRGGYSDLLMQNDEAGRRRMYLAGPHALYKVDLAKRRASLVRRGTYTDLAGCNLFTVAPRRVPVATPPTTATWRGRVLDAVTLKPLPEAVLRLDFGDVGTAVLLNARGDFTYTTVPGRTYQYRAQLPGYLPTDSTWTTVAGPSVHDILLVPFTVGTTLRLANVRFEQGRAVLLPASFPALDKLVGLMVDNPGMTIELRGHTDNVGSPEKNVVLSEQRVRAVKNYLTAHGVAESRITGIGFGGAQPLSSNDQEITRQLNRRVEFRVTGLR